VLVAQLLLVAMIAFFSTFASRGGASSLAVILWIPSLVLASRLVRGGLALLDRRTVRSGMNARGLALWALSFYGALGSGMLLILRMLAMMVRFPAQEDAGWRELFAVGALLLGWPLVALLQSVVLERTIGRYARDLV